MLAMPLFDMRYNVLVGEVIVCPKERVKHSVRVEPRMPNVSVKENSVQIRLNMGFVMGPMGRLNDFLLI